MIGKDRSGAAGRGEFPCVDFSPPVDFFVPSRCPDVQALFRYWAYYMHVDSYGYDSVSVVQWNRGSLKAGPRDVLCQGARMLWKVSSCQPLFCEFCP